MVTRLHADRHIIGDGLTLLNDVRGVGGDGGGEARRSGLVLVQNDHHDGLFHVRDFHDRGIPQVDVIVGVPRHDLLHGHAWIIGETVGNEIVLRACVLILVRLDVGIPCVLPLVLSTQLSVVALVGCRAPIPSVRVRSTDRDHTAVTITLTWMTLVEVAHALVVGGAQRIFRLGHRRQTTSILVKSDLSRFKRPLHGVDIGCRSERTGCIIPILPEHSWRTITRSAATGILVSAATAGIGRGSNDAARGKSGDGREKGYTPPQPLRPLLGRSLRIMLLQLHNTP